MSLETRTRHERGISFWGAAAIGVGGMVGGGIFAVLGLAATITGGAAPFAFLVSGVIALLTAYSYAKLSVAYPSQGGTVTFVDKAFGVELFTGVLNNILWLAYIVTLSLYAVAFANYAATFFPDAGPALHHVLIGAGILVPAVLNLASPRLVSMTEMYVVAIKIGILMVVVFVGFGDITPSRLSPGTWEPILPVLGGAMIVFVAYEGFELIANAVPDIRDAAVTAPRAYYASVLFVTVLYVLIATVTVGALTAEQIAGAADYALAQAARPSLGQLGFTLVAVSAVLATFSAINATIYGSARLAYTIAKEGELPPVLKRKVWNQPVAGLLMTTAGALLLANLADLGSISTTASAAFLVIFAVVNAANLRKAREAHSSRPIAALGVLGCLVALGALGWYTIHHHPNQLWVMVIVLVLTIVVEWFILRAHRAKGGA